MTQMSYQEQVRSCSAEIRGLLPKVAARHEPLIMVATLTEEVGGHLFSCQEARICSPERARAIIERVKQLALAP